MHYINRNPYYTATKLNMQYYYYYYYYYYDVITYLRGIRNSLTDRRVDANSQ